MKDYQPPEVPWNGKRVLAAFCAQGGDSMGWHLAGYKVDGVDKDPQPHYPFRFIQGDAIEYILAHGHEYDVITGGPPCQAYSATWQINKRDHPRLIGATRSAMEQAGKPFMLENVEDARPELRGPVTLCGAMFPGLHTYRHRLFETGGGIRISPPDHPAHTRETVKMGRPLKSREDYLREGEDRDGDWYHAVGHFSNVPYVKRDMKVGWMTRDGISECIPPAYTFYLALQILRQLG